MVISQRIVERLIGYRGTKLVGRPPEEATATLSEIEMLGHKGCFTDKAQRINSISCRKPMQLRYILMGNESNYQIKPLSKQINFAKCYSTISIPDAPRIVLDPYHLTGLGDAEGSFRISVLKN